MKKFSKKGVISLIRQFYSSYVWDTNTGYSIEEKDQYRHASEIYKYIIGKRVGDLKVRTRPDDDFVDAMKTELDKHDFSLITKYHN